MHELAIAEGLVERATEAAREAGAERVEELRVELGSATHLVADQLTFCIEAIGEGTPAAGASVTVDPVPARGVCACGWRGELATLSDTVAGAPDRRCPDCGAGVKLTQGRECRLASITVPD
jgi:hydrogenase nickel incorporation protein HypA/HybF